MEKFEYKTYSIKPTRKPTTGFRLKDEKIMKWDATMLQEELTNMGLQGWELVSIIATSIFRGETDGLTLVFKRKLQ